MLDRHGFECVFVVIMLVHAPDHFKRSTPVYKIACIHKSLTMTCPLLVYFPPIVSLSAATMLWFLQCAQLNIDIAVSL